MPNPPQQAKRGWSAFAIEQKVGLVIFLGTGVVGLILSGVYLRQSLRAPFQVSDSIQALELTAERQAREVEEQKQKDTDLDGISDYDELHVYRTSPYLEDSDSDGIDDGREIKAGDDPNCPTGQACGRAVDAGVNSPVQAVDITNQLPFEDIGLGGTLTQPVQSQEDVTQLLQQLTASDVRAALRQQGIDQQTLDGLSDTELMDLFDGALKQVQTSESTQ